MQSHYGRTKSAIAALIIAAVCLVSLPTAAQQPGPQGTVSDDDFVKLNQQIKELKNATFRAFLRMQLLNWAATDSAATRRQAALQLASQGVTDLCEHQDEVWLPTASWLHEGLIKQIKTLQAPEDTAIEPCVFKSESKTSSGSGFSAGIKMLSNPETSAAGMDLVKAAILSGQVSPDAMLGQLHSLNAAQSPQLPELLSTVLTLEEKQPGTLPLRLLPFFTSLFIDKSTPAEITTRFMSVAVRSSRLPAEQLADPIVRSSISQLMNGIIGPARQFTPALYPEIASRLNSVDRTALGRAESRLAAAERIEKATDQLEQLITEADSTSDELLKTQYFFRAARLAKERGQFNKAIDLALKIGNDSNWLNEFLSEIVALAIKKKSPNEATYAISKMTKPLVKVTAFRLLGEYYGANDDKVKSKDSFTQAAKQLKTVDASIDKVRASLTLAESVLKYEPADAYELFRDSVKAINTLPAPEKEQEKMAYVKLLPVAEELIRSFRLLAAQEDQTATTLAAEIKLPELRLSALSGAYSRPEKNP
jgi:predicted negative regulator of RcsB-dependent stress response